MGFAKPHAHGILRIAWLPVLAIGCGGGQPTPDQTASAFEVDQPPAGPDRFNPPAALQEIPVPVTPGEPLADAFDRARQAYLDQGLQVFDPRRAYASSAARDFAWYFTLNAADDPWGRTQHVFFVVTAPWDDAHTRSFLYTYLVMAAASPDQTGRQWFHFYSAEPPPFAVRFLFSNTAEGALEAAVLAALGTGRWEPDRMPDIAEEVGELALDLRLVPDAGSLEGPCPVGLDLVYLRAPRPTADESADVFGQEYVPEGTLAAVGALLGESLRRSLPDRLSWETDDDPIYPRLHASGPPEAILRPIPMTIEFYLSGADLLPTEYCSQMLARLRGQDGGSAVSGE